MKRTSIAVIVVVLMTCATVVLWGDTRPSRTNTATIQGADLDAQIESLLAMSAEARRAELKKLSPNERQGLWFELKRRQALQSGAKPASAHHGKSGGYASNQHPITTRPRHAMRRVIGTIAYDSGFPTTGFGGGELVGNRFDTHTGIPVLASGTVSTISALVVPGAAKTSSSAGFVLLGPQTGGGGAMALFSTFTAATGVIDSLTFTGLGVSYTGSSFFVLFGDFASVYIPVFGTGTTLAQGGHGLVGYTGGMGPNIVSTNSFGGMLNSFIRATGNIVPVELMSFDVE